VVRSVPPGEAERLAAEESALLARVGEGECGDALLDLYQRYGGRIYAIGLRLLGDRGMAEELVQDTFVRLWRSAGRFDPARGSVATFVFAIARKAAVDLSRRRSSRPLATLPEGELEPGDDDQAYDRVLLGMGVREALDSLSVKHREVLELGYGGDLTQQQIADRLGVPLGTVKTRTYHALRALRSELERRELVA